MVDAKQTWKKRTKAWRLPQWGRYLRQYIYTCPSCQEQVHPVAWPALSAIDLTNLGPTMAERREIGPVGTPGGMLKHTTAERVRRGLLKFKDGPAVLLPTGRLILPWVDQWRSDPAAITQQLATVMTHLRHALASLEPSDEPITDEDWDKVRFRMLEPDYELRRAMAFRDDYHLSPSERPSTKAEMTAGLGNAVTPPVSEWITRRCLAVLGDPALAA